MTSRCGTPLRLTEPGVSTTYIHCAATNCAFYPLTSTLSQKVGGMPEIAVCDRAQYKKRSPRRAPSFSGGRQ